MTPELKKRLARRACIATCDVGEWCAGPDCKCWQGKALPVIDAILLELTAAGYAVVPREPTNEMLAAPHGTQAYKRTVWRAMLKAAESPTAQDTDT